MVVVTGIMAATDVAERAAMKGWTYAHADYLLFTVAETREEAFDHFQHDRVKINAEARREIGEDFMFHPRSVPQMDMAAIREVPPGTVTRVYRPRH